MKKLLPSLFTLSIIACEGQEDSSIADLEDRAELAELVSIAMSSELTRSQLEQKIEIARESGEPLSTEELLDGDFVMVLARESDIEVAEVVRILSEAPPTEFALSGDNAPGRMILVSETEVQREWTLEADFAESEPLSPGEEHGVLIISPAGWHVDHGGLALDIDHLEAPQIAYVYPQGLTCGMSYRRSNSTVVDGYCGSSLYKTLANQVFPSYSRVFTGDFGLTANNGLYHQARTFSSGALVSSQLYLPKGTACGFKHTINSPNVSCLGFDAAVSCPAGWTRRYANDAGSNNGKWAWCEYQDPNLLCTTQACLFTNALPGMVCGITHTAEATGTGRCNGVATTSGCPAGWIRQGFYDWGRAANVGIGWCVRP